jgi:hypothetical protein
VNLRSWNAGDWACFALGIVLAYCLAVMVGLL